MLLNMPKTGSTFTRSVLREYFSDKILKGLFYKEILLPRALRFLGHQELISEQDQHGTFSQIPKRYRNREIVSTLRDPLRRFNSLYAFGWWKKEPPISDKEMREAFDNFPDLTADDFFLVYKDYSKKVQLPEKYWSLTIGPQTIQHIMFYAKNPIGYFDLLLDGLEPNLSDLEYFPKIHFLTMENLKSDLLNYLKKKDIS